MINKTKNPINILIPNATSPRNVGDQAMLEVLITILKRKYKNSVINIHSFDQHIYKNQKIKPTLYSWAVFSNRRTTSRVINILKLIGQYIHLKMGSSKVIDHQLITIVNDYKKADIIIFAGGGYLRSKKGLTQSLNLMMHLAPFIFASLFSARKIVAPISVGPFGYKWQEKIVVKVLKQIDLVALREVFSYRKLSKYKMKNIVLSSDYALMIKNLNKKGSNSKKSILGFTIRKWLSEAKSVNFENYFADSLAKFSLKTGTKIQPIVQVDSSGYGEDDVLVTKSIIHKLRNKNIEVLRMKNISSVKNALSVYSEIDLLLGMRMHSNILAATQRTPFVAISYEYKTEGISKTLGMEKYCIKCENVDRKNLFNLLVKAYKNKNQLRKRIDDLIKTNLQLEKQKWNYYLSN